MKEMVGGCCVCADESGWPENPLVYCDGPGCSVAVHQGCYGILKVPEGNWYCARCSAGNSCGKQPAHCELCSMEDGALKRTDKGGWAHVICALYIPEVQFGDVHSMDPVVLSHIPEDRFSKVCYICEAKGNDKLARLGACMQCNKPGCKKYFHVTCAQQKGMLCEEGGGSKNVKYCGYCSHHFKKVQADPGVKVVPAYKPVKSANTATNRESGSRNSTPDSTNLNKERKRNGPSNSNLPNAISATQEQHPDNKPPASLVTNNNNSNRDTNGRLQINCIDSPSVSAQQPPVRMVDSTFPGSRQANGPSPSPTVPSASNNSQRTVLQNPTEPIIANTSVSTAAQEVALAASTPVVAVSCAVPTAALNSVVTTSPSLATNYFPKMMTTATFAPTPSSMAFARPHASAVMSTFGDVSSAGPIEPSLGLQQENHSGKVSERSSTSNDIRHPHKRGRVKDEEGKAKRSRRVSNKKTVKSLLESVSHVVEDTVSSFQAERVAAAASNASQQHQHLLQQQQLTFSNSLMPAVPGPSTSGLAMTAAQQISTVEGPLPGIGTLANEVSTYAQAGYMSGTPLKPIPKLGLGGESSQHALPTSLEQLLERQWEQGSQFLMKQAEHFDIASLLSCLHQLKVENQRLEENIVTLAGRRDHLLAVNARLSLALGQNQQSPHSPRVNAASTHNQQGDVSAESSPSSALSHLRSLTTTVSPASQVTQAKSAQTQAQTGSTQVLSPSGSRGVAAAVTSGAGVGGASPGFGSGSGVFTTVTRQQQKAGSSTSAGNSEASPDRLGHFLMPRTPTPLLASAGAAGSSLAALTSQYSALSHQDQQMMQLMALQQQAAFNAAALMQQTQQPTSPHRTAAGLAQSTSTHLTHPTTTTSQKS